jgi:hypothetical protein
MSSLVIEFPGHVNGARVHKMKVFLELQNSYQLAKKPSVPVLANFLGIYLVT